MQNEITPIFSNLDELKEWLINVHEKYCVELKKAQELPASIRELEKIELIRQADGIYRLDHAVTATQKTILKAFGIDANYVKRKAREISDQLNPKVLTVRI